MEQFLPWLQEEHDAIMGCEAEALQALKSGDKAGYEEHMRAKAQLLAELGQKAEALLSQSSDPAADEVAETLNRFSGSAAMALRLGSVFFMSALLYKDDHKAGEPDNLQTLITSLSGDGS